MKIIELAVESGHDYSGIPWRYAAIPEELKQLKIWMLWRSEHGNKIPYRTSGGRGSSTDPESWSTFPEAVAAEQRGNHSGIALAIVPPFCGVDLDHCILPDGSLREWAIPIVEQLLAAGAYCEVSPSLTGLKAITRGKKTTGSRCSRIMDSADSRQKIESWDTGRYFALTGRVFKLETGDAE